MLKHNRWDSESGLMTPCEGSNQPGVERTS